MFGYTSLVELIGPVYLYFSMLMPVFGIGAAVVIAEGYLIKIGKKRIATVIILVVFALSIVDAVNMSIVAESGRGGMGDVLIWNDTEDDTESIGELSYVTDNENNILGFGKLKVTNGKAPEYIDLEFDRNHRLTGSPAAMKYETAIKASLETPWKESIEGKSMTWNELQKLSQKTMKDSEKKYFSKSAFPLQFLLSNILTFILILIYFVGSYREKRRKASKMDSSKIQDL